ncbi:non-homologous end-joining DNA ligase [Chelativorans sp. M5D2P16]|uniref:non-homologous end-joining DNA ligase n=1 Tax=Chelativorans sp. M5D2P16 TaxID=3095678 RepID=UPI002ACA6147|nr:non-homologous end-joining DNA ligase [Chelativorans sp. M5D2P16]MDZ5698217.1 non-homologous end-joining DNA ligase [Chelativorans sp. M5D2P16]
MQKKGRTLLAGVALSSPDKILFDAQGLTKADIAAHYMRVAERMLPWTRKRLVSLVRCPDGRSRECFFQKHGGKGFPAEVKRREIVEKNGGNAEYLYIDNLAGLIAGIQMNTLEFHVWGSRIDRLEKPDRLVFDLDPDEALEFADVRRAAFDLRERLSAYGLKSVPLVTGGKGVHVVVPLSRRAEWPQAKAFARSVARTMEAEEPERFLAQAAKAKRKGRVFIDWLRNERGATAIAPYSTRARQGAPVAVPVSWAELSELAAADTFHVADMEARMRAPEPWAETAGWRQSLTREILAAAGAGDE